MQDVRAELDERLRRAGAAPEEADRIAEALVSLDTERSPGTSLVHLVNSEQEHVPGASTHTTMDVVTDGLAFVGDSLTAFLARRGFQVHRLVEVRRDDATLVHAEIDRETDAEVLAGLRVELEDVLEDVRAVVTDWPTMRDRVLALARDLREHPPPRIDPGELAEAAAFLEWLADDHFTFVGACEYRIEGSGAATRLDLLDTAALGVARRRPIRDQGASGAVLHEPFVLTLTKAVEVSTVHRAVSLDDVRVRRFDATGAPVGEDRFVGLYTASVYSDSITRIPLVRRKAEAVIARAALPFGHGAGLSFGHGAGLPFGHTEPTLANVLETLPREELFRLGIDELTELAVGVADVGERRRVRLFVNPDELGRFVSCLVYLPRDRYTTLVRTGIVDALRGAYGATSVGFSVLVGDSVMARLHVVLELPRGLGAIPIVDRDALEAELVDITRAWTDDLREELQAERGEEEGLDAFRRWGSAFPAAYQSDASPAEAAADLAVLETLDPVDDLEIRLVRGNDHDGIARLKLYRSGHPLVLSDVMPVLGQLDVVVVDERPYEIHPTSRGGEAPLSVRWIYSFGVQSMSGAPLDDADLRARVAELFLGVWAGAIENDGLNRLVIAAGLAPRDVVILRALTKYLHQAGVRFTEATLAATLVNNPDATRHLVELFHARLDPRSRHAPERIDTELGHEIDAVAGLDDDRILRALVAVVRAAVRTNAFFPNRVVDDRLAIKLDPSQLDFLPRPRPAHEIWVYSPRVEGVHLRGGDVARGGIRWSDRRDDFRTEILGLMKAQTAKNSVIVPVGAKGGFVVKQPGFRSGTQPVSRSGMEPGVRSGTEPVLRSGTQPVDPDALRTEVLECYRAFIRGLLDLTDNLVDGHIEPLAARACPDLVRLDGDDPYLVVAADKGTATFSDVANELAAEYGYWLGDAFASGGSSGYDHKEMGITARGAWVSVRSHFRAIAIDADTAELSVVGIGDMSGDVFGNGMLRSRTLRLVAAFDHRHVFVDPEPDPERSYVERERLFRQPGSSWADYDPAALSAGGGVFPRSAKSVELSDAARRVLGMAEPAAAARPLAADPDASATHEPTPDEVVSAILRAPVDLLWNGGIGTFVKASTESHGDVGDRVNDAVRVDATELRCRVVAEGGNLGLTQAARVEFALNGGRLYTDAIDNSAGVDCSDHEVNVKILLREAITAGRLEPARRDELLVSMTDEVAALVLADNEAQANALEIAAFEAAELIGVHARQVDRLERAGILDRVLEGLPGPKSLQERVATARGLTTPELAVLLAFTKIDLEQQLVRSDVPDDDYLANDLLRYFPRALQEQFGDLARSHPLARELVSTVVANAVVNRAGISFLSRLADETARSLPTIACAHVIARDVVDASATWAAIDALDLVVPAATQARMFLVVRRLVERAARWFVRRDDDLPIGPTIERYRGPVAAVAVALPQLLGPDARAALSAVTEALVTEGIPVDLATSLAGAEWMLGALPVADLAALDESSVERTAAVHYLLADRLRLDWLRECIAALPRGDRWQTEARAALRDDLTDCHRELTESVIRTDRAPEASTVTTVVDTWLEAHRDDVTRYQRVIDELQAAAPSFGHGAGPSFGHGAGPSFRHGAGAPAGSVYDLAQLTAARRALRELSGAEELAASPGAGDRP